MASLVVVYRIADGSPVSFTDDPALVVTPLPAALATKTFNPAPDFTAQRWDPNTLAFVAIQAVTHNALFTRVSALIAQDPAVTPWVNRDLADALRALLAMTRNLVT